MDSKSAASYSRWGGGVVARGPIDHEHMCVSRYTYCTALHCHLVASLRLHKDQAQRSRTAIPRSTQPNIGV
jgi:hypothetical protein